MIFIGQSSSTNMRCGQTILEITHVTVLIQLVRVVQPVLVVQARVNHLCTTFMKGIVLTLNELKDLEATQLQV